MLLLQDNPIQTIPRAFFRFVDFEHVQNKELLLDFIIWKATPREEREPKTQYEFASLHNLNIDTITDWKKRDGFDKELEYRRIQYFRQFTDKVYCALVKKAVAGNLGAIRLFMELFEGGIGNRKVRRQV